MAAKSGEWYFRNVDGVVYGPAGIASLVEWAREGRITPDGEVSKDRRRWIHAPDLPELEMCVAVEMEPGRWLGPFHEDVVRALKDKGSLPKTARIYHRAPALAKRKSSLVASALAKKKKASVPRQKVVEKIVRVEVPVEKIVEKVVEKVVKVEVPVEKVVYVSDPAPGAASQQPEPPPKKGTFGLGGLFRGADFHKLAALEAAARRELFAARRGGASIGLFRRKP